MCSQTIEAMEPKELKKNPPWITMKREKLKTWYQPEEELASKEKISHKISNLLNYVAQ